MATPTTEVLRQLKMRISILKVKSNPPLTSKNIQVTPLTFTLYRPEANQDYQRKQSLLPQQNHYSHQYKKSRLFGRIIRRLHKEH